LARQSGKARESPDRAADDFKSKLNAAEMASIATGASTSRP